MNEQNADENEKMMQSVDLDIIPTTGEFYNDYQNVADALGILHHPALANDDDTPAGLFESCNPAHQCLAWLSNLKKKENYERFIYIYIYIYIIYIIYYIL